MHGSSNHWHKTKEEMVAALQAFEVQARQIHHAQLELLAVMNGQAVATELGYANTVALLIHALQISPKEAKTRLAHAEALFPSITPTGSVIEPVLPRTAAALSSGDIGAEAVDVIRKTLRDLPDLEPEDVKASLLYAARQASRPGPGAA